MKARSFITLVILCTGIGILSPVSAMNQLSRNDPYPYYSSADPFSFMTTWQRQEPKNEEEFGDHETFRFAASYFRQTAVAGSTFCGTPNQKLGDLLGAWNFVGIFYPERNGNIAVQKLLTEKLNLLTPFGPLTSDEIDAALPYIYDPVYTDRNEQFGFVEFDLNYIKQGVRFEWEMRFGDYLGFLLQAGVAELRQHISNINDLTCEAQGTTCTVTTVNNGSKGTADCGVNLFPCTAKTLVMQRITGNIPGVADALNVAIRDYHEIAAEDTRGRLYLRKWFPVNWLSETMCWPKALFMPYISADVSVPTSKKVPGCILFGLSNGNNGHWGYGASAGFQLDFVDTIQIGLTGAVTCYSQETYANQPVPTSPFQAGIFPRLATVTRDPGKTWSFGANLNAYHFIEHLSFWFEYRIINHQHDCYCIQSVNNLSNPRATPPINDTPPALTNILTAKMNEESSWEVQVANIAFNYDVSDHIELGFFWQQPVKQRNAYRATTLMGTFNFTF